MINYSESALYEFTINKVNYLIYLRFSHECRFYCFLTAFLFLIRMLLKNNNLKI
jgi:hypothetical protein